MRYIHPFTLREGIEGESFKIQDYNCKESKKIKYAIIVWNNEQYKNRFKRALCVLEIYDKAHKYDEITKKKSFWEKFKELFRA